MLKPLLCVTVTAGTMAELRQKRDAVVDADLVELRLGLSTDEFPSLPIDLRARVQAMRATGAEVIKIAATLTSLADCVPLRDLGLEAGGEAAGLVLIGMGPYGLSTRVLPGRFGSI